MAQINLLKQNTSGPEGYELLVNWTARILILLLVALILYWGWLWYGDRNTLQATADLEAKISQQKADIASDPDRKELLMRQLQLQELDHLIDGHVYWSQLMPELARVTLKNASYVSFRAVSEGRITLSVVVPSSTDLDKFLQVFDLPKFNKYFSNLQIGPINKVQEGDALLTNFEVSMDYDPMLLKFKPSGTASQ